MFNAMAAQKKMEESGISLCLPPTPLSSQPALSEGRLCREGAASLESEQSEDYEQTMSKLRANYEEITINAIMLNVKHSEFLY